MYLREIEYPNIEYFLAFSKLLGIPQGVPQFPCSINCVMKWDDKEIPFQKILV